ncbi:hypothetical protein ACFTY8_28125 [Streptomyces mirabilis]|uniref:hypothetical protein n=1 Tax=Streptomyces mirabilis TaxID=68239 RepID=UPI0036345FA0
MSERLRRTEAVLLGVLLLASCATGQYAPDDPAGGAAGGRRVAAHRVEHLRVRCSVTGRRSQECCRR